MVIGSKYFGGVHKSSLVNAYMSNPNFGRWYEYVKARSEYLTKLGFETLKEFGGGRGIRYVEKKEESTVN